MNICAIDPGKPPKTVFAHTDLTGFRAITHGSRWAISRHPPPGAFDVAVAEKPEGVIRKNRTPASVVSPAGWGMAGLFSVQATRRYWVPTEAWKSRLFGKSFANAKKEVFCGNIIQRFQLHGLDPEADKDQDVIDAIGIAEAFLLFSEKEIKPWLVKW